MAKLSNSISIARYVRIFSGNLSLNELYIITPDSDDSSEEESSSSESEEGSSEESGGGEEEPNNALYGLAVSKPIRPFEITDWENLIMYAQKGTLLVNGRTVPFFFSLYIENPESGEVTPINPQVTPHNPPFIGYPEEFLQIEKPYPPPGPFPWYCNIMPQRGVDGISEGEDSIDFVALLTVGAATGAVYSFPVCQTPRWAWPAPTVYAYDREQWAYGQILIEGLKNYETFVPFHIDPNWTYDMSRDEYVPRPRIYTPARGSVQYNGVILPIEEANGGCWVPIEIGKNYYCHISAARAHINDVPLIYGEPGFLIGGAFL